MPRVSQLFVVVVVVVFAACTKGFLSQQKGCTEVARLLLTKMQLECTHASILVGILNENGVELGCN